MLISNLEIKELTHINTFTAIISWRLLAVKSDVISLFRIFDIQIQFNSLYYIKFYEIILGNKTEDSLTSSTVWSVDTVISVYQEIIIILEPLAQTVTNFSI
jgi:hypothetical protein